MQPVMQPGKPLPGKASPSTFDRLPAAGVRMSEKATDKGTRPERLARLWVDYWPQIVAAVSPIGLAISSLWLGNRIAKPHASIWLPVTLFALCAIGAIVGNLWTAFRTQRVTKLEGKIREHKEEILGLQESLQITKADYFKRFRDTLEILANERLGFGYSERISVYRKRGQAFVLLGRYSKRTEFSERSSRGIYPTDEGCIGRAWREGSVFVSDLPDPETNINEYYRVLSSDWNIKRDTAKGFRMKSRSYAAYTLEQVGGNDPDVIIVFESLRTDVLNDQKLLTVLRASEGKVMQRFLLSNAFEEPDPSITGKVGY